MALVSMARRRVEIRGDSPIPDQEAELLIEAISLLAQRQQETEMWAAERIRFAEDRATSAEHRLTSIETQLSALEGAVAKLSDQEEPALIAGTPEECLAKIQEIASTGVNHMILCITDPAIVKAFTGKDVDVPDVNTQLTMIHDEVMPAFA